MSSVLCWGSAEACCLCVMYHVSIMFLLTIVTEAVIKNGVMCIVGPKMMISFISHKKSLTVSDLRISTHKSGPLFSENIKKAIFRRKLVGYTQMCILAQCWGHFSTKPKITEPYFYKVMDTTSWQEGSSSTHEDVFCIYYIFFY